MKRPKQRILGVDEWEAIQSKRDGNLFNRIMTKILAKLEKQRVIQVQEAYRTEYHQDPKSNTSTRTS
jgi:hypothetical protein